MGPECREYLPRPFGQTNRGKPKVNKRIIVVSDDDVDHNRIARSYYLTLSNFSPLKNILLRTFSS
jgi:hypothetical protein